SKEHTLIIFIQRKLHQLMKLFCVEKSRVLFLKACHYNNTSSLSLEKLTIMFQILIVMKNVFEQNLFFLGSFGYLVYPLPSKTAFARILLWIHYCFCHS